MMASKLTKKQLECLYEHYNRRKFVHPDPLEFVYRYDDPSDREAAGFIASSLAYGRVNQILASVERVLSKMPRPAKFIKNSTVASLKRTFKSFRHRFTSGDEMAGLLFAFSRIVAEHGSLGMFFALRMKNEDKNILPAMSSFVREMNARCGGPLKGLLPSPEDGSACKRLNLFLRWMVRADRVDVGAWEGIPASKLVIPLDTHMHRISLQFGLTKRRQADLKTALEITSAFKRISPQDPVRYDFVLTRFGIKFKDRP